MPISLETETRRSQLRRAKRAQRERLRQAGLAPSQAIVPQRLGIMLRECAKHQPLLARLQSWLELEIVEVAAWPQLTLLCWGRHEAWITGADALAIYERNWRFVDPDQLTPAEAALVAGLTERHGRGAFLG